MNRTYARRGRTVDFHDGRYADAEHILRLGPPRFLDVTGDGQPEALVPLQIDEAETARERGAPTFHTFLVHAVVEGVVTQQGELPELTCGPLRADVSGPWLVVAATPSGEPRDMCGGEVRSERYRWDGTWFVDEAGDPLDGRLE